MRTLWRPVGLLEMALVFDSGMRAFPPRRSEQPFFYPVLHRAYAEQIARQWNAREAPFAGYVIRFEIPEQYASGFDPKTVGSSTHQEYWVPSDRLDELNANIRHPMSVERAFFSSQFRGDIPERFGLARKDAGQQIYALVGALKDAPFDFGLEIAANARAVFLNYPFWRATPASWLGIEADALDRTLGKLREFWNSSVERPPLVEAGALIDEPES
jgi:hypothetical protein